MQFNYMEFKINMLPQTQTRTFINYVNNTTASSSSSPIITNSLSNCATSTLSEAQMLLANQQSNNCREERVKVQRLINHTQLQNNSWNNFRTLYNNNKNNNLYTSLSSSSLSSTTTSAVAASAAVSTSLSNGQQLYEKKQTKAIMNNNGENILMTTKKAITITTATATENLLSSDIYKQPKSAFNIKVNGTTSNEQYKKDNRSISMAKYEKQNQVNGWLGGNTNNTNNNIINNSNCQQIMSNINNNKNDVSCEATSAVTIVTATVTTIPVAIATSTLSNVKVQMSNIQRTMDQEDDYRRIESVHNYAKLKHRHSHAKYINNNNNNSNHKNGNNNNMYDVDPNLNSPISSEYSSSTNRDDNDDVDEDNDSSNSLRCNVKQVTTNDNIYCNHDHDVNDDDEDIDIDVDIDVDYEHYFNNKRQKHQQDERQKNRQQHEQQQQQLLLVNNHNNDNVMEIYGNVIKETDNRNNNDNTKQNKNNNNSDNAFNKMEITQELDQDLQMIHVDGAIDGDGLNSNTNMLQSCYENITASMMKPQHHARRPMNAFLIFCKRHRSLVKERYKSLENRAITRILGDWWATLDEAAKECFIKLAQENKDAFFSAHPNFKWYKLPAPPMRTSSTRPILNSSVTNGIINRQECGESNNNNISTSTSKTATLNHWHSSKNDTNDGDVNFFKLADEAQMGDLNILMEYNNSNNNNSKARQCALQQALGETTQFFSVHMTDVNRMPTATELIDRKDDTKRRSLRYSGGENSFSSNSNSEDDSGCGLVPKTKKPRMCKGKIYQELINSGQIATHIKKSTTKSLTSSLPLSENERFYENHTMMATTTAITTISKGMYKKRQIEHGHIGRSDANSNSDDKSTDQAYELKFFNLDERIKELPALDLDDYLQKKRCTKKKKKFTYSHYKKRNYKTNTNSNDSKNTSTNNINNNDDTLVLNKTTEAAINGSSHLKDTNNCIYKKEQEEQYKQHQHLLLPPQQQQQQQPKSMIVGSQKRKARKESITRRDISAIENEVASVLTINGDCYLQETPIASISSTYSPQTQIHQRPQEHQKQLQKDQNSKNEFNIELTTSMVNTTTIIPSISMATAASYEYYNNNNCNHNHKLIENDHISSTSDLLILAEVAAKRTELEH